MANPNVPQGGLNRLISSMNFPGFPALNITAPFLGKGGIHVTLGGKIVTNLPSMTGIVPSPEPYVEFSATVELLKSQPFSDQFKQQWETDAFLGPVTAWPDATTLSPWQINNASITACNAMAWNGTEAVMVITIEGAYPVNQGLYPG